MGSLAYGICFAYWFCFLPVKKFNPNIGCLYLGAGSFNLNLPIHEFDANWSVVSVDKENNLSNASAAIPNHGDVIFLGLEGTDENTNVNCLGFPEWHPSFQDIEMDDVPFNFYQEVFFASIANQHDPSSKRGLAGHCRRLDTWRKKIIYFSMRNQLPHKDSIKGKLIPAKILGVPVPANNTVLLQSGTIFWRVRMEELISGLPDLIELRRKIGEKLQKFNKFLWMRVYEAGELIFGIKPESGPEFRVQALYGIQVIKPVIVGI